VDGSAAEIEVFPLVRAAGTLLLPIFAPVCLLYVCVDVCLFSPTFLSSLSLPKWLTVFFHFFVVFNVHVHFLLSVVALCVLSLVLLVALSRLFLVISRFSLKCKIFAEMRFANEIIMNIIKHLKKLDYQRA
jgi:hypothetical protein